jgi:glycosyltransferase involved in cell wall biosynthesis
MTVWLVPIQPFDERYTAQWWRWFPQECQRQGLEFRVVAGEPLSNTIKVGTFLDVNGSLHYQATQLQRIAELFHVGMVKDGDVFFVADVEFWGIEAIRYLADLNGIRIKMVGFAHAGSYTKEDFFEKCWPYAQCYEEAWGRLFDTICVGSAYHAAQLHNLRHVSWAKLKVTGNPYDIDEVAKLRKDTPRRDFIIHTNRPDPEKRPLWALQCFERLKARHPDWQFAVTTSRKQWASGTTREYALRLQSQGVLYVFEGITKQQYLELLSTAKVMTGNTIEENFGYCILEALILDVIPVVPYGFSHPELVDGDVRCLFRFSQEQDERIEAAMAKPFQVSHYAEKYRDSLERIVRLLH